MKIKIKDMTIEQLVQYCVRHSCLKCPFSFFCSIFGNFEFFDNSLILLTEVDLDESEQC